MRSESASGGDSHCGEEEEEEGQAASCMCEALACNSTPLADYPPIHTQFKLSKLAPNLADFAKTAPNFADPCDCRLNYK